MKNFNLFNKSAYLAIAIATLVTVLYLNSFSLPADIQTQILRGQLILENKTLPTITNFSWSANDTVNNYTPWLNDILQYAIIENLGKFLSIDYPFSANAGRAIMLFLSLASAYFLATFFSLTALSRFAFLSLYLILNIASISAETQVWSLVLLPLSLLFALRAKPLDIILLHILFLTWPGLDADFFSGIAVIALLLISTIAARDKSKALLMTGLLMSTTATAYFGSSIPTRGIDSSFLLPFDADYLENRFYGSLYSINTPNFHLMENKLLVISALLILALSLLSQQKSLQRPTITLTLGSLALVLAAQRYRFIYGLAAALAVGTLVQNILEQTKGNSAASKYSSTHSYKFIDLPLTMLLGLLAIFFSPSATKHSIRPIENHLAELQEMCHKNAKRDLRLFNDIAIAPELLASGVKVFISLEPKVYSSVISRSPSLRRSIFDDYYELITVKPKWEEVLSHWKFDAAIIQYEHPLNELLATTGAWKRLNATEVRLPDRANYIILTHNNACQD